MQDKLFPPARNIERENLQRCANALRFKRTLAYESGVLKTFSRVLDRTESLGTMQARRKMSFFGANQADATDEIEMANISAGANQADATSLPGAGLAGTGHDELEKATISAVNIHPVDAAPAVDDTQPQQRQEASGEVTPRRRVIGHYVV